MRTFQLNEQQIKLLNELSELPANDLFYVAVQQKRRRLNLTLNELKKHIKRSVRNYELQHNCPTPLKYIAIFENTKEFFMSQHKHNIVKSNFYSGFHFHLFISGVSDDFLNELNFQLNSQKIKRDCISKIDGKHIKTFDLDFKTYHLKQMQFNYSPQLVIKRIN